MVESSGDTHAYRYEPAFWFRYMAHDPKWANAIPKRVSASYGLMQIMYPVALEEGFNIEDPPEFLFVPTVGIEYGCRHLKRCFTWAKGDLDAAAAGYNGGRTKDNGPGVFPKRNQAYVDKIHKAVKELRHA
jgi:soluble lytic murein transglycosylase-like protein